MKMFGSQMSKPNRPSSGISDDNLSTHLADQQLSFKGNARTQTETKMQPYNRKPGRTSTKTKSRKRSNESTSGHSRELFYDDSNASNVELNPNLDLKMYTDPKHSTSSLGFHKVHILAVKDIFQNINLTEMSQDPLQEEIALQYRNLISEIQRETNNNSWSKVTKLTFSKYINTLCKMLDSYYSVDSILSFKPDMNHNNTGIEGLRSQIMNDNPLILDIQNRLRRALMNVAIPPNIVNYYRWKNQNFRFSELSQSSCFKITSGGLFPNTNIDARFAKATMTHPELWNHDMEWLITELYRYTEVIAPILKAKPEWQLIDLPVGSNTTVYDTKAIDIFSNSSFYKMIDNKLVVYPQDFVTNRDYCSVKDPESNDGMIEAFTYFNENFQGMWNPIAQYVNRPGSQPAELINRFVLSQSMNNEINPFVHPLTEVPDVTEAGLTYNIVELDNKDKQSSNLYYSTRHDGKIVTIVNNLQGVKLNSRLFIEWLMT